jgi:hypothetical protein
MTVGGSCQRSSRNQPRHPPRRNHFHPGAGAAAWLRFGLYPLGTIVLDFGFADAVRVSAFKEQLRAGADRGFQSSALVAQNFGGQERFFYTCRQPKKMRSNLRHEVLRMN